MTATRSHRHPMRCAFTLVELLVVVSIIAVVLALLAPTLDTAVYQAELSTCGARLHGVGTGVMQYALDHTRRYPARQMAPPPATGGYADKPPPMRLTAPLWGFDWRPTLKPYLSLDLTEDPLSPDVGIEADESDADTAVDASYLLWFGWQYWAVNSTRAVVNSGRGMLRMGDSLEWKGRFFRVLAADWDDIDPAVPWSASTHPDDAGVMAAVKAQDAGAPTKFTFSRWYSGNFKRGPLDLNFLYDDLSVSRLNDLRRGVPPDTTADQKEARITRVSLRVFDNSPETTAMPVGTR